MAPDTLTVQSNRLTDAVRAAASVAPSKMGAAFSQAAGIFLEISRSDSGDPYMVVKSSNLACWYAVTVPLESLDQAEEADVSLRVSSNLLSAVCGGLSTKPGSTVKIGWQSNALLFRSGRLQSRIPLMEDPNILWNTAPADEVGYVTGLSQVLSQLTWCVMQDPGELSGILLAGEYAYSTNRTVVGRVKTNFSEPLPERVVLNPTVMGSVLTNGMTFVGLKPGLASLTSATVQIQVSRFDASRYPAIEKVVQKPTFEHVATVSRQQLMHVLRSADPFLKEKRNSHIEIRTDGRSIGPRFSDDDMAALFRNEADFIDAEPHEPISLKITSEYINGALAAITSDVVRLKYSVTGQPMLVENPDETASFFISTIREI